jgi:FKBP-type peptidyl-prolyl cis-trans isomerase
MTTRFLYNAFIIVTSLAVLSSCGNNETRHTHPEITQKEVNNGLINSHKEFLLQQEDEIKQYVVRHNYDMQKTASGIYYKINVQGKGEQAKVGEFASVSYTISLLDGTVCYDTRNEGPKQFKVGEDEVESGVHEAVQLMHVGDKATFIIPSNLANGLVGDKDKIPPGSIVIYDITLLSVTHVTSSLAK